MVLINYRRVEAHVPFSSTTSAISIIVSLLSLLAAGSFADRIALWSSIKGLLNRVEYRSEASDAYLARAAIAEKGDHPGPLTDGQIASVLDLIEKTMSLHSNPPLELSESQRKKITSILTDKYQSIWDPRISSNSSTSFEGMSAGMNVDGSLTLDITYGHWVAHTEQIVGGGGCHLTVRRDGEMKGDVRLFSGANEVQSLLKERMLLPTELDSDEKSELKRDVVLAVALSVEELIALLLFIAAVVTLKSRQRGIKLHALFAIIQIPAGLFLSGCLMSVSYHSSMGLAFYLTIIPGIMLIIYPIIILSNLRNSFASRNVAPHIT